MSIRVRLKESVWFWFVFNETFCLEEWTLMQETISTWCFPPFCRTKTKIDSLLRFLRKKRLCKKSNHLPGTTLEVSGKLKQLRQSTLEAKKTILLRFPEIICRPERGFHLTKAFQRRNPLFVDRHSISALRIELDRGDHLHYFKA